MDSQQEMILCFQLLLYYCEFRLYHEIKISIKTIQVTTVNSYTYYTFPSFLPRHLIQEQQFILFVLVFLGERKYLGKWCRHPQRKKVKNVCQMEKEKEMRKRAQFHFLLTRIEEGGEAKSTRPPHTLILWRLRNAHITQPLSLSRSLDTLTRAVQTAILLPPLLLFFRHVWKEIVEKNASKPPFQRRETKHDARKAKNK